MKKYLDHKKVIDSLNTEYKDILFLIKEVNLIGKISVIAGLFESEQLLKENWEDLSSSICSHYQMNLDNDFTKWNTYLIYVCREPIRKELKYQIENDKFSNRKIVIERCSDDFDESFINKLISNKIILDTLELDTNSLQKDKLIFKTQTLIGKTLLSEKKNSNGELISFDETLLKIETLLKNENI